MYGIMPIQFFVRVNTDPKSERINKKDLKQSLKRFKQVFKLLESFKEADHSKMRTCGKNETAFVTQIGQDLDYNFREKTIKKALKHDKMVHELSEAYLPSAIEAVKHNDSAKELKPTAYKTIPVVHFEQPDSVGELEMPLSHFGKVGSPGTYKAGGKNLWILKPVGLNRGQGIHVVDSVKKCKKLISEYCMGKELGSQSN